MPRTPALIALLFGLLLAPAAQAWTAFGHRLVAELAYERLAPQTRAQVDALLALEPGADIGSIASWPDEIRDRPDYRHTGPFHYVNYRDGSCRYVASRDCPGGACINAALPRYLATLGDAARPPAERLEALKFVVHLVGDIHQPMHAGNRDDRGGNRFQINLKGEGSNLHAVWDYHILASAGLGLADYRARLVPQVAQAPTQPMEIEAWSRESCELLDTAQVYPARPGNLPKGYLERQRPQVEARIALAAARLAMLLDSTLGGAPELAPEAE